MIRYRPFMQTSIRRQAHHVLLTTKDMNQSDTHSQIRVNASGNKWYRKSRGCRFVRLKGHCSKSEPAASVTSATCCQKLKPRASRGLSKRACLFRTRGVIDSFLDQYPGSSPKISHYQIAILGPQSHLKFLLPHHPHHHNQLTVSP